MGRRRRRNPAGEYGLPGGQVQGTVGTPQHPVSSQVVLEASDPQGQSSLATLQPGAVIVQTEGVEVATYDLV